MVGLIFPLQHILYKRVCTEALAVSVLTSAVAVGGRRRVKGLAEGQLRVGNVGKEFRLQGFVRAYRVPDLRRKVFEFSFGLRMSWSVYPSA